MFARTAWKLPGTRPGLSAAYEELFLIRSAAQGSGCLEILSEKLDSLA